MGGAVSAGEDNDELVDKLVNAHYIKSPSIELFFRMIDRGFYFLPSHRANAYRDQAWRFNSLHISAPCIYSEVLESLQVRPGMSFLNVGSGTGYLSTLVGLLLGAHGINHGIELNLEVLKYSQKKLHQFLKHSPALYLYDFTEPQFILGNAITVLSDDPTRHQYDRVYCGAAVPPELESFMKSLLKIGGILVMPANDQLVQVTRHSADDFETKALLSVTFASLILPCNPPPRGSRLSKPSAGTTATTDCASESDLLFSSKIPEYPNQPVSLKLLCRGSIIRLLRKSVDGYASCAQQSTSCMKSQTCQSASKGKRFAKCLLHTSVREIEFSVKHANSGRHKSSSSGTRNDDCHSESTASSSSSSSSTTSGSSFCTATGSSDSNSLSTSSTGTTCHSSDEAAGISTDEDHMSATSQQLQGTTTAQSPHKVTRRDGQLNGVSSSPADSADTDETSPVASASPVGEDTPRISQYRVNCMRRFIAERLAAERASRLWPGIFTSGPNSSALPDERADELATCSAGNTDTSGPVAAAAAADNDDIAGESSGDSSLSGETGVTSPLECSSKRSLSQTEEETGETATASSSAPQDSGRGSSVVSGSVPSPVLIARLRQRAIEGLRHRRRVKARRIATYSTDSDDSESQDADSTDSSEEERRRNEDTNLLVAPWSDNPLIPAIEKKIKQLPLPPTLQVYVNFCRPLKTDA